MKYLITLALLGLISQSQALKIQNRAHDEVDDLLAKQDEKDAKEVADKEFKDANSKVNLIGQVSRQHSTAEDEDYMKSVFDQYSVSGKDKRGHDTGFDIMPKDKAYEAVMEVIMKWNDLPRPNAENYLKDKFDKNWDKFDVNHVGHIEQSEAFQFTRQLMGTFTSLMDGIDTNALSQQDLTKKEQTEADLDLDKALQGLGF